LVVALIISFKATSAPYLVPVYAALEGMFLGGLSATYESLYNGITLQASLLTMCVFVAFGLMVTLVWLYIEMLRLLAKIASRD